MAKLEQRHIEYLKIPEFYNLYLKSIIERLVYSNNRLDKESKIKDIATKYTLEDTYRALIILLNSNNKSITEELIKKVNNTINEHSMYISNEYRKLEGIGKYPMELAANVPIKIKELLHNYYGEWSKLDIFEREAKFNQEFIRIHPYEDGNGRTSRLLLTFNLLIQGHAPAIIPESKRKDYIKASDDKDLDKIKQIFMEESQNELQVLDSLIEEFERKPKRK